MLKHKQTLSVIIPAHNEEQNIENCIKSLLIQNCPVDEIIVISNNSSDKTAQIAKSFKNVKVIETNVKGLINARDIGFNYSKCDILARINADVVCPKNWSEVVLKNFLDDSAAAVAGVAKTSTIYFIDRFLTTFWSRVYLIYVEAYFGIPILWGSNMALRRTAWIKINDLTCKNDNYVHEDQDLSIHLNYAGEKIVKDTKLIVFNMEKSYFNWTKFSKYNELKKKTKLSHKLLINSATIKYSLIRRATKYFFILAPEIFFYLASAIFGIFSSMSRYLFGRLHSR